MSPSNSNEILALHAKILHAEVPLVEGFEALYLGLGRSQKYSVRGMSKIIPCSFIRYLRHVSTLPERRDTAVQSSVAYAPPRRRSLGHFGGKVHGPELCGVEPHDGSETRVPRQPREFYRMNSNTGVLRLCKTKLVKIPTDLYRGFSPFWGQVHGTELCEIKPHG